MQTFVATLFAVLAVAAALDYTVNNPQQTFQSGAVNSQYLSITNNLASSSLTLVSFTIIPEDGNLIIGYPNSASSSNVGTIQHGATGYGSFYATGNPGLWNANIRLLYKKGSTNYTANIAAQFYGTGTDGGGGSDGRRSVVDAAEQVVAVGERSDLAARTADIYTMNNGFAVADGSSTWVQFASETGTNDLTSVTFTVVPDSNSVLVVYPSGASNTLGDVGANTEKDSSFQITAPAGEHSLNITYRYKNSGSAAWQYTWNVVSLTVDGDNGRRAVIDPEAPVFTSQQSLQSVYILATVAGVAVVAVVAVVGTILYRRRSSETTTTSA